MRKIITITLFCASALLCALCVLATLVKDRTKPEIMVPSGTVMYNEGDDTSVLLDNVTAVDDKDGNISSQVRIYNISLMDDGVSALVTYAVYDSSNNLGKATKVVGFVRKDDKDNKTEDKTESTTSATTESEQTSESTTEDDSNGDVPEGYEDPGTESTGAPIVRLTTHEVKIALGGQFYSMDYVEDVIDDIDTREELYRHLYMDGEYDQYTEGVYELTYYCTDSDGNVSNRAKLKLIVGDAEE